MVLRNQDSKLFLEACNLSNMPYDFWYKLDICLLAKLAEKHNIKTAYPNVFEGIKTAMLVFKPNILFESDIEAQEMFKKFFSTKFAFRFDVFLKKNPPEDINTVPMQFAQSCKFR